MTIMSRLRSALRGTFTTFGGEPPSPPPVDRAADGATGEGHAPGHRHLGPPPDMSRPPQVDADARTQQPWVRTSHTDSQRRRFRR